MNTGLRDSEYNWHTAAAPNEGLYMKETSDSIFQCPLCITVALKKFLDNFM